MIKPTPSISAWAAWAVLLLAVWAPVIYLLGAQWSVFEQYQYGWAVPALGLYLAGARFAARPPRAVPAHPRGALVLMGGAGLVYWGMRLLQEANPVWRLASYGLVLAAVALTLLALYLTQGRPRAVHFAFPLCFLLIAVPWPTALEQGIIQSLSRANASGVVELLNLAGVPALGHGNVIEVSPGLVGIDEACSGIRSFQATLMMALFWGPYFGLTGARRWGLLVAGPGLALMFNLARTFILAWVAAREGLPAMERWHDPTGVALLLGCFVSLWGVAAGLAKHKAKGEHRKLKIESEQQKAESRKEQPDRRAFTLAPQGPTAHGGQLPLSPFPMTVVSLALWLAAGAVVVAGATEAWFRSHEVRGRAPFTWTVRWPTDNATFRSNAIPERALNLLQCDQNVSASWSDAAGTAWQVFDLRWTPAATFYGRTKVALSKAHNPEICLAAAGLKLVADLGPVALPVRPGRALNFDRYVFSAGDHLIYVFFSQSEAVMDGGQINLRMTPQARWRAALAGSRNYGQVNFEVALTGPESAAAAERCFTAQLPDLIQFQAESLP